jgi:RHS repeat-associated protein
MGVERIMAQTYDAMDRIKTETFPAPDNETVSYAYNEAGWLKSVDGYINNISYNARGQKKTIDYFNTRSTTFTYNDPVDRPAAPSDFRLFSRVTSANQQNLSYTYDAVGNVTSITDSLGTASRNFQYDDLNRLSYAQGTFGVNQAIKTCDVAVNTLNYNAIGNITNKCGLSYTYATPSGLRPSAVTQTTGTGGKTYNYDSNGNMSARGTQTLIWDIDNRVASVSISGGGTTAMEYDYTGMRIKKNAPAGITLFPFKGYEIDPNGVATKFIRVGNETLASKRGANKYFYHNDHLGGVHVITDSAGNQVQLTEYDPWGVVSKQVGNIDPTHRFTGQELDPETGFHYYGGRYYDQDISRFVSPDPYVQEPDNPQNLNRYSYVLNNPQSLVDPSGHFWEWIVAALLAVIEAAGAEAATTEILATLAGKLVAISFAASIEQMPLRALEQAELHRQFAKPQQNHTQQALPENRRENPDSSCLPGDDNCGGNGPVQLAMGPHGACRGVPLNCGGPGGDWWGRGAGSGPLRYPAPKGPPTTRGTGRAPGGGGRDARSLDAKVTTHGNQRLAERGWTQTEIATTKGGGKVLTQADGAKVFLHEVSPGKFNVIIEGDRGIITGLKGLDQNAINNLSKNYGWK